MRPECALPCGSASGCRTAQAEVLVARRLTDSGLEGLPGLAGAVPEKDIMYAAEGFKDTTRVASSDPSLWADIFLTNKKEIASACRGFEKAYKNILKALAKDDHKAVVRALKKAKSKRDKFAYGRKE